MNTFIKVLITACVSSICCCYVLAQTDTLYLSEAQVEDIFLKQNLQLIAEKLNIDKAEAAVIQAKLWPNPTLTLDQVNLWTTDAQRQGQDELIPPLFGSFARNTEFAVGLEQVIVMGGKRRKLVEMERVSRGIAEQYFEELVRSLKTELRNTCAEMIYLQEYHKVLKSQQEKIDALIVNYRSQATQGNISQSQLLRLQASLLSIRSEINDLQKDINQQQKNLQVLLNISTPSYIILTAAETMTKPPESLSYGKLIELADNSRPDLKESMFQRDYYEKSLRYEKAQRTPDLTFLAAYDREGNCMRDFVGFGFSIDVPFFNRNQGNIKTAQINIKQSQAIAEYKQLEVHSEVGHALQNFTLAYNFNHQIAGELISNLDEMRDSYTRNFINKNIGIVEFLDFFEAYKDNKRTVLAAQKEVKVSFEELQYAVGTEL